MFSTGLDCGNTSNGVACDSIRCSMPDKGFAGVSPRLALGITPEAKA